MLVQLCEFMAKNQQKSKQNQSQKLKQYAEMLAEILIRALEENKYNNTPKDNSKSYGK